jgi:uncharacterized protein DUF6281
MRFAGVVLGLIIALPALVACNYESCFGPILTSPPQAMAGSVAGPASQWSAPPSTGVCPIRVEYDGRQYEDTRAVGSVYGWSLTDADLTPIGHATRGTTNSAFRVADDSVYAIPGVDPKEAIAMHAPGGLVVFVADRNRWPDVVCGFLVKPPTPATVCPSPGPSAEPTPTDDGSASPS